MCWSFLTIDQTLTMQIFAKLAHIMEMDKAGLWGADFTFLALICHVLNLHDVITSTNFPVIQELQLVMWSLHEVSG